MFAIIKKACFINYIINFNRCLFAQAKTNSEWIYSNKAQQMSDLHKGKVFICTDIGLDVHNCSLRMHKAIQKSHLVMAYNEIQISLLMKAISNIDRYVKNQQSNAQKGEIIKKQDEQFSLTVSSLEKQKQKHFQTEIQLSRQIQMSIDIEKIYKSNNDRQNRILKVQQDNLLKYLQVNKIKQELVDFKSTKGYPKIISLTSHLQRIKQLRDGGIDLLCFLSELESNISSLLIKYLEKEEIPYQILPTTNSLVNLLASTGFPADRFAIEYFPQQIENILIQRKGMKMTISLLIRSEQIIKALEAIVKVYGKQHKIYFEINQLQKPFRGVAQDAFLYIKNTEMTVKYVRMAISPFISTFNEQLKQDSSKVSRIFGQAMAQNTHFVRIGILNDQLGKLKQKKDNHQIVLDNLILELLGRNIEENVVENVIRDLLKINKQTSDKLIKRAKSKIQKDYIGLQEMIKKR